MRETKTSIWGGKSQMEKRVVVTGIGVVSPVGNNVDAMWESIKAGKHGIAEITRFDLEGIHFGMQLKKAFVALNELRNSIPQICRAK